MIHKVFPTTQQHVDPADPDMAAIRKFALRDVKPEEVWCGALKACNTLVDRSGERFSKAYLQRFADTLPGKPLLIGHDYSKRPVGRIYAAAVIPDGQEHYLKTSYYTRSDSPIVAEVELGIQRDCSVGFNAGKRTCDLDGKAWTPYGGEEFCGHWPLQEYDGKQCTLTYCESEAHKAEGMEMSLVWVGCQYGAEAVAKMAGPVAPHIQRFYALGGGISLPFLPTAPPREESGMFKTIEEATAEIERLKKLPLAAEREAELQKAIVEKEPLAKDGATYRQSIRDNVLRMAGAIDEADKKDGKTPGKVEMYTHLLGVMPSDASAESLLAVEKGLKAEFEARFAKGAANADGPGDDEDKTKKKSSPFGRLAMGGLR